MALVTALPNKRLKLSARVTLSDPPGVCFFVKPHMHLLAAALIGRLPALSILSCASADSTQTISVEVICSLSPISTEG